MSTTGAEEQGRDTVVFELSGGDGPGGRSPAPRHRSAHASQARRARMALGVLAGLLALACAGSLYLWLELESERSGRSTAVAANEALESRLETARTQLAAVEDQLAEAEGRLADTEQAAAATGSEVGQLNEQLAAVQDELDSTLAALSGVQEQAEAVASEVVRSLNFLAGCVRAQQAVVDEIDESRNPARGQVAQLAEHALEVCQDALVSLRSASPAAEAVLSR